MPAATGAQTRLMYLWEDSGFKNSPSDSTYKTFGREPTLDTLEGSNNAVRQFEPNNREAQDIIEQEFSGSFTVSFTLSNPWWIRAVLSEPTSSTGTYTYDGDFPDSMRIVQAVEPTDEERILEGCVVTSATIDASVPDTVSVNLDGAYADERVQSVSSTKPQPSPDYRAYQFAQGNLDLDGSRQSRIQSASLSIENNTDMVRELGDRFAVDFSPKARNPSIDYVDIVNTDNTSRTERLYGESAASEPQSTVENKKPLTLRFERPDNSNDIVFNIGGSFPDSYSLDGTGDPTSDLEAELSEMAETITAEATGDEDTAL